MMFSALCLSRYQKSNFFQLDQNYSYTSGLDCFPPVRGFCTSSHVCCFVPIGWYMEALCQSQQDTAKHEGKHRQTNLPESCQCGNSYAAESLRYMSLKRSCFQKYVSNHEVSGQKWTSFSIEIPHSPPDNKVQDSDPMCPWYCESRWQNTAGTQ